MPTKLPRIYQAEQNERSGILNLLILIVFSMLTVLLQLGSNAVDSLSEKNHIVGVMLSTLKPEHIADVLQSLNVLFSKKKLEDKLSLLVTQVNDTYY